MNRKGVVVGEDTMLHDMESPLFAVKPEDAVYEEHLEEYRTRQRVVRKYLTRMDTILRQLETFAEHADDLESFSHTSLGGPFFPTALGSMREVLVLTVTKLTEATSYGDKASIDCFAEFTLETGVRDEYRNELKRLADATEIPEDVIEFLDGEARYVRDKLFAHLDDAILDHHPDWHQALGPGELAPPNKRAREAYVALARRFRAFCFGETVVPELVSYAMEKEAGDVAAMVRALIRDSPTLNQPELCDERDPDGVEEGFGWKHMKKNLTDDELDRMNWWRRQFGLPPR